MLGRLFALALGLGLMAAPSDRARAEVMTFEQLKGWHEGGQAEALKAFLVTCDKLEAPQWGPLCALAKDVPLEDHSARAFFEMFFRPVLVGEPPALFTGYFEPELNGAKRRSTRHNWPIYRRPPELNDGVPYLSRAQIEDGALNGRGLELAWLDDPVEVFFLHIQGSGRVKLADGSTLRVGYAGKNNHPYRSIGQELVRRGIFAPHQVSAQVIANWVRQNPALGAEILDHNPSYVFFRPVDIPAHLGPIGAMGRSISPLASVAIDPAFTRLGTPIWIEKTGRKPLNRLMIAQDTGGAIKGAQRADIFYGYGDQAGLDAGEIRDGGRMLQLLPIDLALAMVEPL